MPIVLRWLLRLGPTNPIAVRLVHGGSRRRRDLYVRSAYLGVIIAVLLYSLLLNVGPREIGLREMASHSAAAFAFAAYLQIALICILAPVFMAGAIAQEANPRTWDILLTTPLSAAEIVLGNLFGRLFFILALLFSSLPLFAVTQYFGGVPGTSIFASYLVAACAALLVGAIAIALSVSRLVGQRAVFAFYVAVISYLALTWGIDYLMGTGRVGWLTALNPFLTLNALLNPTGYPRLPSGSAGGPIEAFMLGRPVTAWCVLSSSLSVLLMIGSVITVRIGGLAKLEARDRTRAPWYRRVFGLGAEGAEYRAPRAVWHNPIAWREAAARNATFSRLLARWSFIGIGGAFALGLVIYFHTSGSMAAQSFRDIVLAVVFGQLAVLTLVAINMAATSVAREREDGTLDLILTTPVTPAQYLSGKLRGMVAYLLPMLAVPIGTLGLAGAYVGLAELGVLGEQASQRVMVQVAGFGQAAGTTLPAMLPESLLVASAVVIPFVAFCVMVGMHWSLKSKGSLSSVILTVSVVAIAAGSIGLCAYQGASDLPVIGPSLAAFSPASTVLALTMPEAAMSRTIADQGLFTARLSLVVGAGVSALVHLAVVYGIHAHMVRSFDMTVRKLAGVK